MREGHQDLCELPGGRKVQGQDAGIARQDPSAGGIPHPGQKDPVCPDLGTGVVHGRKL